MVDIRILENNSKLLYQNGVKEYKVEIKHDGSCHYKNLKFNIIASPPRDRMVMRGSVDTYTNPPSGTVTDIDISFAPNPSFASNSTPLEIELSPAQITRLNANQIITLLIEVEAGQGVGMNVIQPAEGFPDPYLALTIDIINAEFEDPINSTTHVNITMNELPP